MARIKPSPKTHIKQIGTAKGEVKMKFLQEYNIYYVRIDGIKLSKPSSKKQL